MKARVLLTDGGTTAALAAARSLARAGHRVSVLASSRHDPAAASRAVHGVVPVPDPRVDSDGWTDRVADALRGGRFDVFLPMTDGALLLADRMRDAIPGRTVAALPSREVLSLVTDKVAVLARAAARGIPVLPRRVPPLLSGAPLPAVVKPGRSRVLAWRRVLAASASVVGDPEALANEAARLVRAGHGAYVEPWVPGEGRGIFLLVWGGKVLARFAHRRIRESSPLGGPSAVAMSVEPDPALLGYAEELALHLGVEGPFMAEFRGVPGEFVLLEVNARYWGSLPLAVDAGVDFPALHVAALLGAPVPGPDRYARGLVRRNLPLDLAGALRTLSGPPPGVEIPWPSRRGALARILVPRGGGMIASGGDPSPGRALLVSLLLRLVRHVG